MKKIFIFLSLSFLLFFGIAYSAINVQAFTNEKYDVTIITLVDGSEEDIATLEDQYYGSSITPISSTQAPEGFEFSFWIVNNIVRKDLESDHTFFVTANLEITAVFEPIDNSKHAVLFMDSNGRFIEGIFVENGGTVGTPSTLGYSKPNYVVADEPWKDTDGNIAVFENITESKVFVLQYKPATEKVVEISVNGDKPVEYAYNEIVTVSSDLAGFTHWEEDGVIVSYKKDYSFTALANRNLVAKNDGTVKPLVSLLNVTGIREDYKSFLGQVYLPEGYTLIEAGILASNDEKVLFIDSTNTTIVKSNSILETTNEFLRSFPKGSFSTFRAYAVLKNGEAIQTVYSENNFYSVPEIIGNKYTETFDNATNLPTGSNYEDGSFIGVNNVSWIYGHSQDAGDYSIDGKSILLRRASDSYIEVILYNGLKSLSFDYRRGYTGTSERELEVTIISNEEILTFNSVKFGSDDTHYKFEELNLNITGELKLRIKNIGSSTSNRHSVIDNITWEESSQEETITKLYNVEFNVDENSTNDSVRFGETVNEPTAPTKTGYSFVGWFDENDEEFDFETPINENITLYAKWELIPVVIKELFISEYGEGSSNNKWLELYNPTNSTINLADYSLKLYSNGATTANNTLKLTGSLAAGETYVIAHTSADKSVKDKANITTGGVTSFNGDDAIALYKNDVLIDVVGSIGSTTKFGENKTLIRIPSIVHPNTTYTASEWNTESIDDFSNIGTHTVNP